MSPESKGDFARAPFADATFDAVFVQDIHTDDFEMDDILRTLRPGGILIFSKNDCMNGDKDDLRQIRNHPQLRPVALPFIHRHFSVFQKGE